MQDSFLPLARVYVLCSPFHVLAGIISYADEEKKANSRRERRDKFINKHTFIGLLPRLLRTVGW